MKKEEDKIVVLVGNLILLNVSEINSFSLQTELEKINYMDIENIRLRKLFFYGNMFHSVREFLINKNFIKKLDDENFILTDLGIKVVRLKGYDNYKKSLIDNDNTNLINKKILRWTIVLVVIGLITLYFLICKSSA